MGNVEVVFSHDELVIDVAKRLGATCLVRGLRNAADLQYEASFDYYNHQLSPDIETIYLHSRPEHLYISSSGVRELFEVWSGYCLLCSREYFGGNKK